MKGYLREIYRKLYLTIRFFTEKRVMTQASALSYSTLLAIVPILAVVFAIARGFGYNKYIELWFRESLSTQPQVADIIVGFVNSYLVHTQSGIFLGVGLVFMLYSVLMLISNIEDTFNQIWQLSSTRPIIRSITNYLAICFLFPIIIVVSTGLSIFMETVADTMDGFRILGPAIRRMLSLAPCVLMSLMFIILYVYMPNTKVRFSSAIVPGILAGIAMQVLQLAYIHSQIWVTGYNAIYGSFAALPLFMLWIQISWTICLFGAQLTFTNENMNRIGFNLESLNVHPKVDMTDEERGNTEIFADNIDDL
ncbi:MAG: YihY/virulence factor BrkB family protein [Prevotella sp.]|jgi:membrane protein|nr:YihY/virulence factor BrkB family protein [Prevotella sp.]